MAEDIKDVSTRGALMAIAIATIVIAVVASVTVLGPQIGSKAPKRKQYQAVFLTNGQVYFGKLRNLGGKYVSLQDVYTVQSQAAVQASASPGGASLALIKNDQNNLIKPESNITISSDSILFWENMQNDAEVVKKINDSSKK
ncbi:hypothetical protein EXS54_00050 [Patescibacteria group bacterium]|nr:hypothetical protein [Patescibacteria group bacterium]